ncbi:hypothetical protein D3C72_1087890 [compost metagenome]
MCTPASNWLIILTFEPCPGCSPRRYSLAQMASKMPAQASNASGAPAAITDISPAAALAAPPEMGASMKRSPMAARRAPRASANSGATVAQAITTLPGARLAAAPCSPNSTASVCCALTTTISIACTCAASAAGDCAAWAPWPASACTVSARTSQACTSKPARSNDCAMPMPMAPRPITPTFSIVALIICSICYLFTSLAGTRMMMAAPITRMPASR